MIKFHKFKDFVLEGGWQTVKTQNTKLNPKIVKKAINQFVEFGKNFNKWAEKKGHEPMDFVEANGSSGYVDRDLEETPDRVYGDVDYLVILPVGEYDDFQKLRANYNKIEKKYRRLVGDFVEQTKPKNVPLDEYMDFVSGKGTGLIFEIEKDVYIQIDFVFGYPNYKEWMQMRFTPEYNLKGFVTGMLFSSFGKLLNLDLSKFGVIAKMADGKFVPFATRKDVSLVEITQNPKTFFVDIAKYLASHEGFDGKLKLDPILSKTPGLNRNNITAENISNGILGFARTMELNGLNNAKEFIAKMKEDFLDRNKKVREKPKFDKAETQIARDAMKTAIEHSLRGDKIIKKMFK